MEYLLVEHSTHDCNYETFVRKFPHISQCFSYKNMKYHVRILWKLEWFLEKISQYHAKILKLPSREQEKFRETFLLFARKYRDHGKGAEILAILGNRLFFSAQEIQKTVRQKTRGVFGI